MSLCWPEERPSNLYAEREQSKTNGLKKPGRKEVKDALGMGGDGLLFWEQKLERDAEELAQRLRVAGCPCRGHGSGAQCPRGGSQLSVTAVPGELMLSSDLQRHQDTCGAHTHASRTLTHKKE